MVAKLTFNQSQMAESKIRIFSNSQVSENGAWLNVTEDDMNNALEGYLKSGWTVSNVTPIQTALALGEKGAASYTSSLLVVLQKD